MAAPPCLLLLMAKLGNASDYHGFYVAGHNASLNFIAQGWSNATGIEKEKLLKRWAHGIFPAANQPYGAPDKVMSAFKTVGRKYIDRLGNWRLH